MMEGLEIQKEVGEGQIVVQADGGDGGQDQEDKEVKFAVGADVDTLTVDAILSSKGGSKGKKKSKKKVKVVVKSQTKEQKKENSRAQKRRSKSVDEKSDEDQEEMIVDDQKGMGKKRDVSMSKSSRRSMS